MCKHSHYLNVIYIYVLREKFEVRISFDVSYFIKKKVFFNIELNAQTGQIDIDLQLLMFFLIYFH